MKKADIAQVIRYVLMSMLIFMVVGCGNKKISARKIDHHVDYVLSDDEHVSSNLPLGRLGFEANVINFGDVLGDTVLNAIFVAKNISDNDVVIEYVNPDCTCTSYRLSKNTVHPGDTVSVTLVFDTKGKSHKQTVHATMKANTEPMMHKLLIRANIVRSLL